MKAGKRWDGGHDCPLPPSLLAQVFPSTFAFISGRSIPAAVWRAAHLLLQHAQAGFLLGHGPLGREEAGDPAICWSETHLEYQDQPALAAPAALDQVAGHWLGRMQKAPTTSTSSKKTSAIIEAREHSLNPWCGLSNVVCSARTVWTRYSRMPAGIFYVEHMDLPKRARVPIEWPPIAGKGLVVTTTLGGHFP